MYCPPFTAGYPISHMVNSSAMCLNRAERQAEFFQSLGLDPGGAVAKEELLALELSPDYRHECGICDRDYMLRRGCPCCRD